MQTVKLKPGAWERPAVKTKVAPEHEATRARIMARVKFSESTGCWEWQGAKSQGYSIVSVNGKSMRGHRVMYEMFVAPIPSGKQIDHMCCNRACVNPRHLEPVTAQQNAGTRVVMRKTGLMPVIGREPVPVAKDWHKDLNFAHLDHALSVRAILNSDPATLRADEDFMRRLWHRPERHDY